MPNFSTGDIVLAGILLVSAIAAFGACMYMSYRDRKANNTSSRR